MQPDPKQVPERKRITPNALRDAAASAARLAAPVFRAAGYQWDGHTPDEATIAATIARLTEGAGKFCGSSSSGRLSVQHWFEDGWEQYEITLDLASVIGKAPPTQPSPESGSEPCTCGCAYDRHDHQRLGAPCLDCEEPNECAGYETDAVGQFESGSGEEGERPEEGVCPECDHDIRPSALHARDCSRNPFNQPLHQLVAPTQPLKGSEVERRELWIDGFGAFIKPMRFGKLVLFEDYSDLQAQLQRVVEERDALKGGLGDALDRCRHLEQREAGADAERDALQARIEQAAKDFKAWAAEEESRIPLADSAQEAEEHRFVVLTLERCAEHLRSQSSSEVGEKTGAELIAAERERQVSEEGYTAEHDDNYGDDEGAYSGLVRAAICYAAAAPFQDQPKPPPGWPWHEEWWKPSQDESRNLTRAGALLAAEIDRLQRAAAPSTPNTGGTGDDLVEKIAAELERLGSMSTTTQVRECWNRAADVARRFKEGQ